MILLANPVRLAVRQAFVDDFNNQLAAACAQVGIPTFAITFNPPGFNYFDGPMGLDGFLSYLEEKPDAVPALCLHSGRLLTDRYTNAVVSGRVWVGGYVFLQFPLDTTDFESLSEAVAAAVTGIMQESQSDDWGGGTYEGDLLITPSDILFHNGRFYRTIHFEMSFRVTAN